MFRKKKIDLLLQGDLEEFVYSKIIFSFCFQKRTGPIERIQKVTTEISDFI